MRRLFAIVLVLGAAACAQPTRSSSGVRLPQIDPGSRPLHFAPAIDVHTLGNGLRVALVPEHGTNLVRVDVRYLVGAAEDPVSAPGLAHAVEHMTFLVRETPDGATITERLRSAALSFNAYTEWDETHYFATGFRDRLGEMLAVEALRMQARCDRLDEAAFDRERQVIVQEIRQRTSDSTAQEMREALFGRDHAYGRGVGGTEDSIAALDRRAACGFIDRHYGPNRAILVVSGAIEPERTLALVQSLFAPVTVRATGKRARLAPFAPRGGAVEIRADVREPALLVAFGGPSWGSADRVWARVAARLIESELDRAAEKDSYVTEVSFREIGGYRGGSMTFALSLSSPDRLDDAVKLFSRARQEAFKGLESEHIAALKAQLRSRLVRRLEAFGDRAASVADYVQYGDARSLMLAELATIDALDARTIEHFGRQHLTVDRVRIVFVRPREGTTPKRTRVSLGAVADAHDVDPVDPVRDVEDAHRPLVLAEKRPTVSSRTVRLDNGIELTLVPDFDYPTVEARVIFPVGYAHDTLAKPGVAALAASLLEHDLERAYDLETLSSLKYVLSLGGDLHADVGEGTTTFGVRGLSSAADGLLWQLHWLLENGVYQKLTLDRLRRTLRDPDDDEARWARYGQRVRESLFGRGHPYATPSNTAALLEVSLSDLALFRDRFYGPTGARIIVAGRFDANAVEAQVRRLWGAWRAREAPPASPAIPPARPSVASRLALVDDEAVQPFVMLAYPTSPYRAHEAARRVLDILLTERLRGVRERLAASYGVGVSYTGGRGPGAVFIGGAIDPERAGPALRSMRDAIASLATDPAFDVAFARARRRALEAVLGSSVHASAAADELEHIATNHLRPDHYQRLAEHIARLTPADLRALIARDLDPAHELVVLVAPADQLEPIYRAAGILDFQRLE